jgi:mRNA interferase MazF
MTPIAAERSLPEAGDLVWADLRPTKGREQAGVRPVLVLTDSGYHQRHATAIVCPVTRNRDFWPTKVLLPEGLAIEGAILVDHIRCLDRTERGFRFLGRVPDEVLAEVRSLVAALIGLDLARIVAVGRPE